MVRRESHHLMFASRSGVHRDPGRAFQYIHFLSHLAHPHFLADILPRHRIAAPLPVDISIAGHLPQFAIDVGIARATRDGLQAELFYIPTNDHLFSGGSMHPLVGHGRNPLAQLRIHIREAMRFAPLQSAETIPAQVFQSRFNLALGLRSIRPAQPRCEAPVPRKIQKHRMPDDLATLVTPQPHCLHAVVENLFGNTTYLPKRLFVHPQQRADLLVHRYFRHQALAITHREGEGPKLLLLVFALQGSGSTRT